jgi:hypothetical protein
LVGKHGIEKKAMPKLFGAWIDKSLSTCVFTKVQKQQFTVGELLACPWYLETIRRFVLGEEMDEHAATASKNPMPKNLSLDVSEPEDPVEVAKPDPPRPKKLCKKKPKKPDAVDVEVQSAQDVAPLFQDIAPASIDISVALLLTESLPADASIDVSSVPHCPLDFKSLFSELFTPSQLYAQNSLRADRHSIQSSVLVIQDSISRMLEHMEIENTKSTDCAQIIEFAQKVY